MKSINQKQGALVFRLSLRISLIISGILTLLLFLLLRYGLDLSWGSVIPGILATAILTYTIPYYVIRNVCYNRLDTLNNILHNIASKDFKNYDYLDISHNDELDYITTQAIRTNYTVEREIKKMSRVENYRKEFIGDVFHELKTPVFAIQGFIETLLDGAIDDEEVNRKFLNKAMSHTNRLINLTNDLMQISKLETGELQSDYESIYLYDLVKDVAESLQYQANLENIDLTVEPFEKDLMVYADRHQIRRVLSNLIDNAIKYNSPGGDVYIGVKPYEEKKNHILVYIWDTGIGVEQREIDRLTDRFYRVDKSRSRKKGGTGLGLSIVKHIMEAHGEELFIESTPGEGSTFSFTLTEVYYPSV